MTRLLNDLNGTAANGDGDPFPTDGGSKTLVVWANDFGGASVAIEISPDGGTTWIPLEDGGTPLAVTQDTSIMIDRVGQGALIRGSVSGATVSTSGLNVQLFQ